MILAQAQRALAARDSQDLERILLLNFEFTAKIVFYDMCVPYSFILDKVDGVPRIAFGLRLAFGPSEPLIIVHRMLQILPLIKRIARHDLAQTVWNMSDHGPDFHVSFCANTKALLIPDCEFISSMSYANARVHFSEPRPWLDRRVTPFWRGSNTGLREGVSPFDIPRVRLCLLGVELGYDFALSSLVQCDKDEKHAIESTNLVGGFVPWQELSDNQFNIDIDGNSSSWSGLFLKLLSGSVVIKIASPHGFRQWFYNRLIPWLNFVPVKSDLSDLSQIVDYLKRNPNKAIEIAQRGRELALSLSFDREMAVAEEIIFEHAHQQNATEI